MTNFIQNKYHKLYFHIIITHEPKTDEYSELHHIIPKSLGGDDSPKNLKRVSARVHFILHYLLTKFTTGKDKYAMARAFNMMARESKNQNRYLNSRLYAANKKLFSEAQRFATGGTKNSQYGKIWMTNPIVDVSAKFTVEDIGEALSQNWEIGRKSSKFIKKLKASQSSQKETLKQLIGKTIKIYKNGFVIEVRELFFYRDYSIEGWRRLPKLAQSTAGAVFLKNVSDGSNLVISKDLTSSFVESGFWEFGMNTPNHKGTRGKTYKWVEGKKIFD